MSEKEIFDEAKKRLSKRFYTNTVSALIITAFISIFGMTALVLQWENNDSQSLIWLSITIIVFLFLSFL